LTVRSSIYHDYNATTPVDPEVVDVMLPYFTRAFGNAASGHAIGRAARTAVERAREEVAWSVGARPSEVVFMSGATESDNLAVKGLAQGATKVRRRIVTFATEHKAVLDTCESLRAVGFDVDVLGVAPDGQADRDALADTLGADTLLVSIMAVNNETGVISPVREIADRAHAVGALVHCDATQALGKVEFDVSESGADLVSVSSHKVYGPQGVGALVVNRDAATRLRPLIDGGGHERGLRSGTLNLPGIVGFGAAARIARRRLDDDAPKLTTLRDYLERRLLDLPGTSVNGGSAPRVPGTTNIRFDGADGDAIMLAMPWVAVSTGSACSSATIAPSHVLRAMGLDHTAADECLRFSLGRFTTQAEVDDAVAATIEAVSRVRAA
jgi:cysteine desulfurase